MSTASIRMIWPNTLILDGTAEKSVFKGPK